MASRRLMHWMQNKVSLYRNLMENNISLSCSTTSSIHLTDVFIVFQKNPSSSIFPPYSFLPMATCADNIAWFTVRAQMWRLWTAVTPFTANKPSRTSPYFTPDGVPEAWIEKTNQTAIPLKTLTLHCNVDLVISASPSIRTRRMSLRMVKVVHKTRMENTKVQMGSAILYSGWKRSTEKISYSRNI